MAKRSISAAEVAVLDGLLAERGRPHFIRCDNGPEFIAELVASWAGVPSGWHWRLDYASVPKAWAAVQDPGSTSPS